MQKVSHLICSAWLSSNLILLIIFLSDYFIITSLLTIISFFKLISSYLNWVYAGDKHPIVMFIILRQKKKFIFSNFHCCLINNKPTNLIVIHHQSQFRLPIMCRIMFMCRVTFFRTFVRRNFFIKLEKQIFISFHSLEQFSFCNDWVKF